jgi:murein DD-endopeptidase MepM/ murein hydrolase activator NlpD
LQQHPDGAQRPEEDLRQVRRTASVATRINRRSISAMRALQARFSGRAATSGMSGATLAAAFRPFMTAERALPVAVAAIVATASLLAVLPNTPQGAVGGAQGSGTDVRIAVGGGLDRFASENAAPPVDGGADSDISFVPVTLPEEALGQTGTAGTAEASAAPASPDPGLLLADGTLLTGYAPATVVEDGSDLIQNYRVKSGDTLVSVAHQFGVSMMTLWWANKLKSKDALRVGQTLRIPTVNGLVVTVKETDTIEVLASTYHVSQSKILELNQLEDPTLVVGQVLILPEARGEPIPTPKPTPKPVARPRSTSSHASTRTTSHVSTGGPSQYSGGSFHWPVVGGGNYISQYYHYGHSGVDIAATYGSPVVAAAAGTVIYAGWGNNGGGNQVWISHGSGIITTYNHMSAITVGRGESVGRGEQVGRIGQSGHATGPHLHFEVWRGGVPGGPDHRVNPMRYF